MAKEPRRREDIVSVVQITKEVTVSELEIGIDGTPWFQAALEIVGADWVGNDKDPATYRIPNVTHMGVPDGNAIVIRMELDKPVTN